jgi:virginiamycin A acetyltransferase
VIGITGAGTRAELMVRAPRSVGHGAIMVTADVPDQGIVGGDPARPIRTRYGAEDVARLLAVAWWDRPAEHLTEQVRTLDSGSTADPEAAAPAVHP